ncbi:NAD-dependent epimerase/dehydratase family protein [Azovibrio restrictus]|uniref:NAD-dependent epimerase/dehydratase family protein n=1 Tax=Azovibrio restrictus TaxID=146938 RepID=UPI0004068FCF|nr:GDP-mannose 4,6-dehydratase [Azovibrio restrictus]
MRALITGIEGFTGRYVAAELEAAGYLVFGTCSRPELAGERVFPADLLDAPALTAAVRQAAPDVVVHLAALAFVGHGDPAAFYQTNVIGTRNLLAALDAEAAGVQRVLLASSANVYGNQREGLLDEQVPPNPANDYAVSKLAMEYMARVWMERLPIILARPFNYTGVGQSESFLLPKIVAHFRRRAERIELGNLDVYRDFSDVRAVAQAYRRLLAADAPGQVVNICSGRTVSLRSALELATRLSGHRMEVCVNPAFVRQGEVHTLGGVPDHLRQLIGAWDSPPLEETLAWMLGSGPGVPA